MKLPSFPGSLTLAPLRAVLFDHDGTLVESEPLQAIAWRKLFEELGIPLTATQTLSASVGKPAPVILERLLNESRPNWRTEGLDVHALAHRKNDLYLEIADQDLQPYPGVRELLQWLKSQKVACAVVSNAKRRELLKGLELCGIRESFDLILSRDDVSAPKPDPAPYLTAAATLGFSPEECLAVEDSPTGLESALMGRIPAAAVMTHFSHSVLATPVLGRPDLRPVWIGPSIEKLFEALKTSGK